MPGVWTKPKNLNIMAAACALVLLICLITGSFALLSDTEEQPHTIHTSNIDIIQHVYFLQDDGGKIPGTHDENGYLVIDLDDRDAVNYAEKLRIDLEYTGITKAYLRVFIGDMWMVTENGVDTAIFKEDTAFDLNTDSDTGGLMWLDNRTYDNYFYYIGTTDGKGVPVKDDGTPYRLGALQAETEDQSISIPFIAGMGEHFNRIEDGKIYMEVRVETVQYNRIEAFWETDEYLQAVAG